YRAEIDGLRAVAVLSVIISHFDRSLLPSGHLGVDIFFVISGFVITQSLVARQHTTFRSFIHDFYDRRVKRILPALVLSVVVTFVFALLIINPESNLYTSTRKTAIAALFGVSNFYLLHQATDYFSASAKLNPFTQTWSLGVEEQFYLLFPLLFWFSGITRKKASGFRCFAWIISVTGALSLLSYFLVSNTNPVAAFYLMPTRFWELATGSIAYLIFSEKNKAVMDFSQPLIAVVAVSLIASLFIPREYPVTSTFLVVLSSAILIVTLRPASFIYRILTTRPVIYIGVISYSLYLWHWSVLTLSHLSVGINKWTVPFQLALIFILALLSYRYVEKPLRRADWSFIKPGKIHLRALGHGLVTVFFVASILYILSVPLSGLLFAGKPAPLILKGVETLIEEQDYRGLYFWQGEQCVLTSNDEVGKDINFENCTFGDFKTAKRRFLVIGNSFSVAELEMFKVLVDNKLGSVTITSSWGASAVPEIELNNSWSKANNYYWSTVIPSLIEQLQSGDIVIIINDGKDFMPENFSAVYEQRFKDLRNGLGRLAEKLKRKGISILYQSGNPFILEANCTPDTA
ncbi:MAG: acyltransferase family protein, partial [Gammaproteobacteria bacterium]